MSGSLSKDGIQTPFHPDVPSQAPERPSHVVESPEMRRATRREEIIRTINRLSEGETPDGVKSFRQGKEDEYVASISAIEAMTGVSVREEIRATIHQNVVEESLAHIASQSERLFVLRQEKAGLDADDAIEKLRSYNDPELHREIEVMGGKPYVYGSPEAGFDIVGTAHTNDPESLMVAEVVRLRDAFVHAVPKEQAIFMVEGMSSSTDLTPAGLEKLLDGVVDQAAAVRKFGEKGVLLWGAREDGIEVVSPERPESEIVEELTQQGFSKDELALYLTIRQFTSEIGRLPEGSSPDKTKIDFARMFFSYVKLTGVDWISQETTQTIERAITKGDMSVLEAITSKIVAEYADGANRAFATLPGMEERKLIPSVNGLLQRNVGVVDEEKIPVDVVNTLHDATSETSVINRVSAAWNGERDKYLVRQIAGIRAQGKKSFVVYGALHAIAMRPALEVLAENT